MIADPIEILTLYSKKGLNIVYCDTDRSRLGLAERLKSPTLHVMDMKDEYTLEPGFDPDIAIIVYTNKYALDFSSCNELAENFIFFCSKDLEDDEPATEDEHGWKEM